MDDHREGIQADKPVPPWEQPGCFRMDCEPHRGNLLWWLAYEGFWLGIGSLLPSCCYVTSLLGISVLTFGQFGWVYGLIGIPYNLCIRCLSKADLAKMQAGRMDPAGEAATSSAANFSTSGVICSIFGTVVWGGLVLIVWCLEAR